jgi:hypothetical protein
MCTPSAPFQVHEVSSPSTLPWSSKWAALLLLSGCVTGPSYPLPEPLPEVLGWTADPARAGNFLGLDVRENDSGSLEDLFFAPGVKVTRVEGNSPAEKAGFQVGDVLLELGGHEVNDPEALETLVNQSPVGEDVTLRASRGDSVFDVKVQFASKGGTGPETERVWRSDPSRTRAGWLTVGSGVRLVTADPRGPVAKAGMEVGTVVTALDGEPVYSARSLIRRVQILPGGTRVRLETLDSEGDSGEVRMTLLSAPNRVLNFHLPFLVDYTSSPDGDFVSLELLDVWLIWLFNYERIGLERRWSILRFIRFSSGIGELGQ